MKKTTLIILTIFLISCKGMELREAAGKGDTTAVKKLLNENININSSSLLNADTALMEATKYGQIEVVKLLLDNKADVNQVNGYNANALFYVAALDENGKRFYDSKNTEIELFKILIKAGVNVNNQLKVSNSTALMSAAFSGDLEKVKLLVDAKADVNLKDKDQQTALFYAKKQNHVNVVNFLKKAGATE